MPKRIQKNVYFLYIISACGKNTGLLSSIFFAGMLSRNLFPLGATLFGNSAINSNTKVQNVFCVIPLGCKESLVITSKSIMPKTSSSSVSTSTFHKPSTKLFLKV